MKRRQSVGSAAKLRGPDRADRAYSDPAQSPSADVFDRLAASPNLLTVKELATLLAVSPKTIYNYAARNLIPHFKIAATVRFRAKDIADWLRSHAA